ncbi:MAG: hypothetical protein VCF24_30075 [Candidatus Latescibacterota bacterium]
MRHCIALLVLALPAVPIYATESLDLAVRGWGLSLGNSRNTNGLRINLIDHDVERVTGVNLTLWKARRNPDALIRGVGVGLIGPYARRLEGIALGGVYTITEEDMNGIAFGGLGVDVGGNLNGIGAGIGGAIAVGDLNGIAVAGIRSGARGDITGIALRRGTGSRRR